MFILLNDYPVSTYTPYLFGLEIPLPLIHASFLYLYTGSLTNILCKQKVQIAPVALTYLVFWKFFMLPVSAKLLFISGVGRMPGSPLRENQPELVALPIIGMSIIWIAVIFGQMHTFFLLRYFLSFLSDILVSNR